MESLPELGLGRSDAASERHCCNLCPPEPAAASWSFDFRARPESLSLCLQTATQHPACDQTLRPTPIHVHVHQPSVTHRYRVLACICNANRAPHPCPSTVDHPALLCPPLRSARSLLLGVLPCLPETVPASKLIRACFVQACLALCPHVSRCHRGSCTGLLHPPPPGQPASPRRPLCSGQLQLGFIFGRGGGLIGPINLFPLVTVRLLSITISAYRQHLNRHWLHPPPSHSATCNLCLKVTPDQDNDEPCEDTACHTAYYIFAPRRNRPGRFILQFSSHRLDLERGIFWLK